MSYGLPVGAVVNCADNTGAKNLYLIAVKSTFVSRAHENPGRPVREERTRGSMTTRVLARRTLGVTSTARSTMVTNVTTDSNDSFRARRMGFPPEPTSGG